MIKELQFYISRETDPYKNLAIEKYLLDATKADCCTLYLWQNQNTVVIGKNQNPWSECRCSLLESEGGKLARRLSGGGAVFHDLGNLNFTFLCQTANYDLSRNLKVIQAACRLAGIETEVSGRNDILAGGRKFSGNAFYNAKGKSYHHGTLLISADTKRMQRYLTPPKVKLEAKGIKSVKSRVVNLVELSPNLTCADMTKYMISAFEKIYALPASPCKITNTDEIAKLSEKYGSWDYLYGSSIPFSFLCEDRFDWGHIQLQIQVTNGIIKLVKVYTDSMDWQLAEVIETALLGCRFEIKEMTKAVSAALPEQAGADVCRLLKEQEL